MTDERTRPGAFVVSVDGQWLTYDCPCGCHAPGALRLVPQASWISGQGTWGWDGNRTHPTLTPSIRRTTGCKFHGHLTAGIWTACTDGPPLASGLWN